MNRRRAGIAVVVAGTLLLTGCTSANSSDTGAANAGGPSPQAGSASQAPRVVSTIATGLKVPWGLAFLPDGSALVSERDVGDIVRFGADRSLTTVGRLPQVVHGGEGGLLGLAISPDFARTTPSTPTTPPPTTTAWSG